MAEIILPPEENEEVPQVPELNIDKPTENSKVITIEFEAKKTNKVSTKDTNQQLYTTDTDAWFEFKETSLEGANGTYSVVFRNRHDGSIFQRTGDVVSGVAYYKIPHQEIRHAGAWRGQIVYTLSNGDTTSREFDYDVKGHILDGKDVREIVVEDFETLMSQLRSMKDNAEVELADLTQELRNTTDTAEQNETDRQVFFDDLVEDINEFEENERQRQASEQARESAESVRVANEAERISKDSERDSKIEAVKEDVEVNATNLFPYNEVLLTGYSHPTSVSLTLIKNHKYYTRRVYTSLAGVGNSISGSVRLLDPTVQLIEGINYHPNQMGVVMDYSDETRTGNLLLYGPGSTDSEGNREARFNDLIIIDLTEAFGVGNEPTAEQMDKLLEQFPNGWFDGTVNVYNSKHMMTMFFKELTKLNNAITTLGGNV